MLLKDINPMLQKDNVSYQLDSDVEMEDKAWFHRIAVLKSTLIPSWTEARESWLFRPIRSLWFQSATTTAFAVLHGSKPSSFEEGFMFSTENSLEQKPGSV